MSHHPSHPCRACWLVRHCTQGTRKKKKMLSCNCISIPYIKEIKKSNKSFMQAENVGITSSRKINFRSFWPCFLRLQHKKWQETLVKQTRLCEGPFFFFFLAQRMPYHRSGDLMEFSVRTYSSINFFLIYFFYSFSGEINLRPFLACSKRILK